VTGPVDTDHQGESAVARGRDARSVRRDDDSTSRPHRQAVGRVDQDVPAVAARRKDAGADTYLLQLRDQQRGLECVVEQHRVMAARVDGDRH
jgi:hypothetical protein